MRARALRRSLVWAGRAAPQILQQHGPRIALGRVAETVQSLEHPIKVAAPFLALGLAQVRPVVVRREDGAQSAGRVVPRLQPLRIPPCSVGGMMVMAPAIS
jgi:hypothetical protein